MSDQELSTGELAMMRIFTDAKEDFVAPQLAEMRAHFLSTAVVVSDAR